MTTTEQQEFTRMAQRASMRLGQTFHIYSALIVGGDSPTEALRKAEEAIEVWSQYEDEHHVEAPSQLDDMLSKFQGIVSTMEKSVKDNLEQEEFYQCVHCDAKVAHDDFSHDCPEGVAYEKAHPEFLLCHKPCEECGKLLKVPVNAGKTYHCDCGLVISLDPLEIKE